MCDNENNITDSKRVTEDTPIAKQFFSISLQAHDFKNPRTKKARQ